MDACLRGDFRGSHQFNVPRKELFNPVDGVIRDAGEDMGQISFRIEKVGNSNRGGNVAVYRLCKPTLAIQESFGRAADSGRWTGGFRHAGHLRRDGFT